MAFCPTCNGIGKLKQSLLCPDCNGKGIISKNLFNFIQYYQDKKKIEAEIDRLEIESGLEDCPIRQSTK